MENTFIGFKIWIHVEFSFQGFLVYQDNPWSQQFDIFNSIIFWLLF